MGSQSIINDNELVQLNGLKDVVITELFTDGYLSEKHAKEAMENYNVVVVKTSWFSKVSKLFNKNGKTIIKILKTKNKDAELYVD